MSTTLSVRGQITIPRNLRDHLGLRAGDQIDFEFAEDGSIPAHAGSQGCKEDGEEQVCRAGWLS